MWTLLGSSPQEFEAFQLGETTDKSPSHLMVSWFKVLKSFQHHSVTASFGWWLWTMQWTHGLLTTWQAGHSLSIWAVSCLMWWPVTWELPFSPPSLPYTPLTLSATLSGRQLWRGVWTESSEAESQKGQGGWSPQEEKKMPSHYHYGSKKMRERATNTCKWQTTDWTGILILKVCTG